MLAALALCGQQAYAQAEVDVEKPAMNPTSATDANVKIHNNRRMFLLRPSYNRSRVKATENEGQSLGRAKKTRRLGKESKVFQRHNHFARKEKASRGKTRSKKTSARK